MKKLFENWNEYKNETQELDEGFDQYAQEMMQQFGEQMTPENIVLYLEMLKKVGTNFWPVGLGAAIMALHDKYKKEDEREKKRSGEGAPVPPRDDM